MSHTLVLVGCGKAKADEPREAQELYVSSYFHKKKRYAQYIGDEWRILSAEHHILHPEQWTEPYDTRIDQIDEAQWARNVAAQLHDLEFDELIVLAGSDYITPVDDLLERYNAVRPFDDTEGIGEQSGWLTQKLSELRLEQHDSALDW